MHEVRRFEGIITVVVGNSFILEPDTTLCTSSYNRNNRMGASRANGLVPDLSPPVHCSKKCSKYLHSPKAKEEHEKS